LNVKMVGGKVKQKERVKLESKVLHWECDEMNDLLRNVDGGQGGHYCFLDWYRFCLSYGVASRKIPVVGFVTVIFVVPPSVLVN
jgi:hypothetical protein